MNNKSMFLNCIQDLNFLISVIKKAHISNLASAFGIKGSMIEYQVI